MNFPFTSIITLFLKQKKRKVHKIHMLKGKRPLGLSIIGGKGSKYGDVGIFIKDILVDGAAYRFVSIHN